MRRLLPKVLCILLVSLLLAGAVNLVRPNPVPWIQDWDGYVETKARDAGIRVVSWSFVKKQFEEQSALFVDARSVEEFEAGHIPDAISRQVSTCLLKISCALKRNHWPTAFRTALILPLSGTDTSR